MFLLNRGKFVTALGLTWCPEHFVCSMGQCRHELHDVGFVEEQGKLYCETCFENYLAPTCARCSKRVKAVHSFIDHLCQNFNFLFKGMP